MTQNDPLSDALSKIFNAERIGMKSVMICPASSIIKDVLRIMNEQYYVGIFEEQEDRKSILLNLIGKINRCGGIKPRYPVRHDNYEKFEKRFLPAKNFGILIVSTPKGVVALNDAKKQKSGGRLLAYCY